MRESLGGMGLLAPTVLILIGLVLYPFFYAIWLAFTDKTVGSPGQFVGFRNFAYVLAWPQFTTAVWNTVVFTVSAVAMKFVLGMAVALVLNQGIRDAWRNFPFYAISFLAGMQTISQELYDSAQVDGASRIGQFRHITLPGLYHIIGVVLLLTTIQTANAFEPIYLLTGGGPSDATMVYTMLVYVMGMMNLRLGEAAAVSTLFLPLLIALVLAVTILLQRKANA
ncbi:MAG: hypothetical protein DME00_26630 [Candidatus Rokuibacteriota bacterium]|nr:MAG: hypothetical protein DME00_26630 [Candidatus Rokubacteria bacterium]